MQYRLTNRDGAQAVLDAAHYERDGSGTRFYDLDGNEIASFYDGELRSVVPASVTFTDADES